MGKLNVNFLLNGTKCTPTNWRDISIKCIYDGEISPAINVDEFTFVNEDAQRIFEWVRVHTFEGMPFVMQLDNGPDSFTIYGCIDFTELYQVISPVEVRVKIKIDDSLDLIDEKLKAMSYGFLASPDNPNAIIGRDDYTDIPVIVKKKFDAFEVAFLAFAQYFMAVQITNEVAGTKDRLSDITEAAIDAPASKAARFFKTFFKIVLAVGTKALMFIAIYPMIKSLKEYFLPTKTKYKGILLRKALTKACDHLGLEFVSDIPELDYYVYLPSKRDNKIRKNKRDEGIPNDSDYGYALDEMFELCQRLFRAKRTHFGGKLYLYSEKDPFWRNVTNYVLPDVLTEQYELNFSDMKSSYIISFQYDPSDEWTMPSERQKDDYFKGTNYQVITKQDDYFFNEKYRLSKGLEEISLPVAIGARRDKLSAADLALKALFIISDQFLKIIGQETIGEKINEHKGALQISSPSFNVAKLVVIQNGLIPKDHRHLLSANKLYNEYHWYQSFVQNPDIAQKKKYKDVKIPFDFGDFLKVIKSGYFSTSNNGLGLFTSIEWKIDQDFAICSYDISERYAFNLTQSFIEA